MPNYRTALLVSTALVAASPAFADPVVSSVDANVTSEYSFNRGIDGREYYFVAIGVTPTETGIYKAYLTAATMYDPYIYIYNGSFNPASVDTNLLGVNDDADDPAYSGPNELWPLIEGLTLTQGQSYVLVATSYTQRDTGTYTVAFSGPGVVNLQVNAGIGGTPINSDEGFDEEYAADQDTITFAGGTLKPLAGNLVLTQPVDVQAANGVVDPNGHTVTMSGAVSGDGQLTVNGTGTVVLAGTANNTGGIVVSAGTLQVSGSGSVNGDLIVSNTGIAQVASGGTVIGDITAGSTSGVSLAGVMTGLLTTNSGATAQIDSTGTVNGNIVANDTSTVAIAGAVVGDVTANSSSQVIATGGSIIGNVTAGNTSGVSLGGSVTGVLITRDSATAQVGGTVNGNLVANDASTITIAGSTVGDVTSNSSSQVVVNGAVSGNVTVNDTSRLSGTGMIGGNTAVAGILAPGNSPGTLTIAGDVTLTPTGTLDIDIDGTGTGAGAGNYDRLIVTGADSVFTADGTLAPILRGITGSATNTYTPPVGQGFTIVSAEGGIAGAFDTLVQPAAGMLADTRLDTVYGSNTITLYVTPASYGSLSSLGAQLTPNQVAVGAVLDRIRPAAGVLQAGDIGTVFNALYPLTASQVPGALAQMSGVVHAETLAADLNTRRRLGRAVIDRMGAIRSTPVPVGMQAVLPEGKSGTATSMTAGWTGWGKVIGSSGRVLSDSNAPANRQTTAGLIMGLDREIAAGLTAGASFGYGHTKVDNDDSADMGTIDAFQLALYGSQTFDAAFIDGAVSVGYSSYKTDRAIAFGTLSRATEADMSGIDGSAELGVGYRFSLQTLKLEPRIGLRYDRIHRNSGTEDGGDALDLTIRSRSVDALRSSVGVRASATIDSSGVVFLPVVHLAYERELTDNRIDSRQALNGTAFTVQAVQADRDAFIGGIGLTAQIDQSVGLFADYGTELRSRYADHTLRAGIRLSW